MPDRVAVHFNFQTQKLSVRQIRPTTGRLGNLIGEVESIALENCEFTVNPMRLARWQAGNKHARQCAEIRGHVIEAVPATALDGLRVAFNPRLRPEFFAPDNDQAVRTAEYVTISGRNILAFGCGR